MAEQTQPRVVYRNSYCDEELADVGRDVFEAFDSDYNPKVKGLPDDGEYTVTITWNPSP